MGLIYLLHASTFLPISDESLTLYVQGLQGTGAVTNLLQQNPSSEAKRSSAN